MSIIYYIKKSIKKIIFSFDFRTFREFNSFPFNPEMPLSVNRNNTFIECIQILKDTKTYFRVTDGTVLGIYRDGKLIEHDNDIDVDVIVYDKNDVLRLIDRFAEKKYTIGRIVYYENKIQQLVFFNKYKDIFDVLFWWQNDNKYYNFSERGFVRSQDILYFKNLSFINFLDLEIPAPFDLEKWLVIRYGEDWNTPKTFKSDWKLECFDIEKI